jgi:hypothetical protein
MKKKLFYLFAFLLLAACSQNNPKDEANKDTTTSFITTTDDTATTTAATISPEDSAKAAKEEFEKVFSRSIQILKSSKIRNLSEVIDPQSGLFLLFNGGGAYNSYQVFPDMTYIDTLGEDDRAVSRLKTLAKIVSGAKDNEFVVQYPNDVKETSPCYFKKKGTFAMDFGKPVTIVTSLYQTVQQMIGDEADPDELNKLKKIDQKITRVVIMNVFKDGTLQYPETLYFSSSNGKWYLIGINMIDCYAA